MESKKLIKEFVFSNLLKSRNGVDLKDTDSLIENGIIDSLGIMKLIVYLEKEFDVKITDAELTPENFENIETVSRLVESKLA